MDKADTHKLFDILLAVMGSPTVASRRLVEMDIFDAHNGKPDGYMVTNDNMYLFRQYRNSVSPSPRHMVDAALAYAKTMKPDTPTKR